MKEYHDEINGLVFDVVSGREGKQKISKFSL